MASSSGVARGYLRPGLSRSPPFLLVGLLLTAGVAAFNYWNLSSQYEDLVKEITELQEHVQIVTLKRETAEKHVEALQQRLSESGDTLGHMKVDVDNWKKRDRLKEQELERLHLEMERAAQLLKMKNQSLLDLRDAKKQLEVVKLENDVLKKNESVLQNTIVHLKTQMAGMSQQLANAPFQVPPIRQVHNGKTDHISTSVPIRKQRMDKAVNSLSKDVKDGAMQADENKTPSNQVGIQHQGTITKNEEPSNADETDYEGRYRNNQSNIGVAENENDENDMWGQNLALEVPIGAPLEDNEARGNGGNLSDSVPEIISSKIISPPKNTLPKSISPKNILPDKPRAESHLSDKTDVGKSPLPLVMHTSSDNVTSSRSKVGDMEKLDRPILPPLINRLKGKLSLSKIGLNNFKTTQSSFPHADKTSSSMEHSQIGRNAKSQTVETEINDHGNIFK